MVSGPREFRKGSDNGSASGSLVRARLDPQVGLVGDRGGWDLTRAISLLPSLFPSLHLSLPLYHVFPRPLHVQLVALHGLLWLSRATLVSGRCWLLLLLVTLRVSVPATRVDTALPFITLSQKSHSVLSTVRRVQKPTPFQGKVTQTLRLKEKSVKDRKMYF